MANTMANTGRVAGIPAKRFEDSIQEVLSVCEKRTDGRVSFEPSASELYIASKMRSVSAASWTRINHLGETAGILTVMALGPRDDTGIGVLKSGRTPKAVAKPPAGTTLWNVTPRPRGHLMGEAYLPIACLSLEDDQADPRLFAGELSVFGTGKHDNGEVQALGKLGRNEAQVKALVEGRTSQAPALLLITGKDQGLPEYQSNYRPFGISYALYNHDAATVKVGAMITLTAMTDPKHFEVLQLLAGRDPGSRPAIA